MSDPVESNRLTGIGIEVRADPTLSFMKVDQSFGGGGHRVRGFLEGPHVEP